jgi:NAD(P)-dependent dehydrogenase (short-subunit alcohol dehydrogenase family)
MQVDLNNQVALVTGAAQGIGKAIGDAFAANGAKVLFTDVDVAGAEAAAERWSGCVARELDVRSASQVESVVDEAVRDFGSLDIAVNNAGCNTLKHRVPIDQFPTEEWDRILQIDLQGLFLVSKAVAGVMRKQGSGRIINIASVLGLVPARLQCAFVAAKGGVISLTKAMAIELAAAGVLVNGVAPGSTLTAATKQLFYGDDGKFKDAAQRLLDHIPLGRPGEPEEIAHAALFLAAPESSYITGQVLTVDGGWTAGYLRDF